MNRFKFLVAIIILSSSIISAQKTYVVSVGIADYKELNDLKYTINDVQSFSYLMNTQNARTISLLDNEATHANIVRMLKASLANAKRDDTMIFFFSGHGYEGGLCCWDMAGLNRANRYCGGLSYAEIQILFRNCNARKKIVIADACFSGGLRNGNHLNVSVQYVRNGDVVYFLSSRNDETSLEMSENKSGLFTFFISKGFSGEADKDYDKSISIKEIYEYVSTNVNSYCEKKKHSQHPVIWGKFNVQTNIFSLNK